MEEEKAVYERSSTKNVYLNVAVNSLKRLRNHVQEHVVQASTTDKRSTKSVSHEAILGGKQAMKTTYTLNRMGKSSIPDLSSGTTVNNSRPELQCHHS